MDAILAGQLAAREQDDSAATYAPKIVKADAKLDWTHPTTPVYDQLELVPLVPRVPSGWATRYGEVDALVAEKDNAFVLINGGDELTVEFAADQLPPKPPGRSEPK